MRPRRPAPRATTYTGGGKNVKKETKLGLTVGKDEDFGQWYSELVVASELISYYDVSGCYILRPAAYAIWEHIKDWFDAQIKVVMHQSTVGFTNGVTHTGDWR